MGNGYVNLLWQLLLINNGQGKQVIYYIQNIINKIENIKTMQAQKQLTIQLTKLINQDLIYINNNNKVDQLEH